MKPPSRVLKIPPPFGGIVSSVALENQPPGTVTDSLDFWPINYKTKRQAFAQAAPLKGESATGIGNDIVLLERVNGVRTAFPQLSMVAAEIAAVPTGTGADLYVWDGSQWQPATGAEANDIGDGTSGQAVLGRTFLNKVYIANGGAAPQVFDYSTGLCTLLVASAGTIPLGMRFFEVWQGALWGAGQVTVDSGTASPNVLFASRVGDATDWDETVPPSDTGGAFFTAGEDEGLLRGPIHALIPHTNSTMYVCTAEGIAAMYGHPRSGGLFLDYSDYIVLGPTAWCKGPDDTTYAMTTRGMIALPTEEGAPPVPLSYAKIPDEFQWDIEDVTDPQIVMEYDAAYNAIHITHQSNAERWYYDLNLGGFHRGNGGTLPVVAIERPPITLGNDSSVLFGTVSTGFKRYNGSGGALGGLFTSSITFAPIKISPNLLQKGKVVSAKIAIVEGPYDVNLSSTLTIATGKTSRAASDALAGTPQYTRSFGKFDGVGNEPGNFGGVFYPRVSGNSMAFELSFSSATAGVDGWIFEGAEFNIEPAGFNRGP